MPFGSKRTIRVLDIEVATVQSFTAVLNVILTALYAAIFR
jgi:hypothetical protein